MSAVLTPRLMASEHFALSEFARSASFPAFVEDVPATLIPNVQRLARVLEVIRSEVGPLTVLSGYRSPRLNLAVGGSPTSQHLLAEAVDVTVPHKARVILTAILDRRDSMYDALGQVIYYPKQNFVHIALPSPRFRKMTVCLHAPPANKYAPLPFMAELSRLAKLGY